MDLSQSVRANLERLCFFAEAEKKRQGLANPKRFTVETVLVTASDVTEDLKKKKIFQPDCPI